MLVLAGMRLSLNRWKGAGVTGYYLAVKSVEVHRVTHSVILIAAVEFLLGCESYSTSPLLSKSALTREVAALSE